MSDQPPVPEIGALTGAELIAEKVRTLPNAPGVYRMIDRAGEVIYVGKARDLKKRVSNYTKGQGHTNRIARMILATEDMAFVQTASETEALLLEANLIKRFRPRYNVLLRDDKSFPNILLTRDHAFPQIVKHRGARTRKGDYFGPFASAGAVGRTLNTLQRAFLLRSCTDSVFDSRTRPCLLFQIKRCSGPCAGRIDEAGYATLVSEAETFLTGRSRTVTETLGARMEEAAASLDFESAARLRDRIKALAHIQQTQGINPQTIDDADVIAIHAAHGETCIQVFFFRAGQNWGNRAFFPRHDRAAPMDEVLDSFLAQFYDGHEPPKLILLSHDVPGRALLAEALTLRAGRKIEVTVPQRGEKREIALQAALNAREALMRRQAESAAETELLLGVQEVFGLEGPPRRIEVYDNSHISGSKPVGGMIVAGPRGFEKGQYRKFNIKTAAGNDDFAMMREMLSRRFARLAPGKEEIRETGDDAHAPIFDDTAPDDDTPEKPDLILIDGGPGQLSSALEAFRESGVEGITIAAISKGPDRDAGRENFHLPGRQPFMLEPNHPVLFYLQRLRDEAHRFAIGSHRARRSKAIVENPLDAIEGIGARRKRALLLHFGSAKAIRNASASDLATVEGVSEALARRIYDHFRA
ncbi:MAG: excinuclease ABC subunit UvrC [Micropepsaceae bacterium]